MVAIQRQPDASHASHVKAVLVTVTLTHKLTSFSLHSSFVQEVTSSLFFLSHKIIGYYTPGLANKLHLNLSHTVYSTRKISMFFFIL